MNHNPEIASRTRKTKGKAKWLLIMLALVVLVAGAWAVYRYAVVGWLTTDVTIESVGVSEDGSASIGGKLNGFAGLKEDSCVIDEDTAVVELCATWPVFGRDAEFIIIYEEGYFSEDVTEIVISDGRNQRVVWTKE